MEHGPSYVKNLIFAQLVKKAPFEHLDYVKGREFVQQMCNFQFLNKDSAPWSQTNFDT